MSGTGAIPHSVITTLAEKPIRCDGCIWDREVRKGGDEREGGRERGREGRGREGRGGVVMHGREPGLMIDRGGWIPTKHLPSVEWVQDNILRPCERCMIRSIGVH